MEHFRFPDYGGPTDSLCNFSNVKKNHLKSEIFLLLSTLGLLRETKPAKEIKKISPCNWRKVSTMSHQFFIHNGKRELR